MFKRVVASKDVINKINKKHSIQLKQFAVTVRSGIDVTDEMLLELFEDQNERIFSDISNPPKSGREKTTLI